MQPYVAMVLSYDRKITYLFPTWEGIMVLEAVNAALSPVTEFIDFISGENVSISAMKPLIQCTTYDTLFLPLGSP